MRRWAVRRNCALALSVILAGGVFTGCASRQPSRSKTSHPQPHPRPSNDARLIGQWRVTRVQLGGEQPTPADASVTTSLAFDQDQEFIDSDERCNPPTHFTTDGSWITLHRPGTTDCAGLLRRTRAAVRVAEAVQQLTSHSRIRYELHGTDTLTLSAGSCRVLLRRGVAPQVPTTLRPSSPRAWSGTQPI